MGLKKIMAVYTHEHEREEAKNAIQQAGQLVKDSFVIGDIEEDQIAALEQKGLIVRVLGEATPAIIPSHRSLPGSDFDNMISLESIVSSPRDIGADPAEPSFYIITIEDPLLDEYVQQLTSIGIDIIERISPNNYTAYLSLLQFEQAMDANPSTYYFVRNVKLYDGYDTGTMINKLSLQEEGLAGEPMLLDLLLHRVQDLETTVEWLKSQHVEVVNGRSRKIRIKMFYDAALLQLLAEYKFIKSIEQFIEPKFQNNVAKEILNIESSTGGAVVVHITQTGANEVIGVADTGIDHNHLDLANAIVQRVSYGRPQNNDTSDPVGHGTHVTGSIVGGGQSSQGKIKGTAPDAKIFFQSLINVSNKLTLPAHLQDLFQEAYNAGARIHNNSWGSQTPSTYTINSLDVDEFVHQNKDMLIVISAGNQGDGSVLVNVAAGLVELGSVGAPATAKSALTVGACRSSRNSGGYSTLTYGQKWANKFPHPPLSNQKVSGDVQGLAGFSSRGPTAVDYRIKPDLVAPGTDILSARSSTASLHEFWGPHQNAAYAYMGGTSMAAPLVAGCAALVRQYYREVRNHLPSAALLKATLINSTDQLTAADALGEHPFLPNYHQGFGRLNMTMAIPNALKNFTLIFKDTWKNPAEQFTKGGARFRYKFHCSAKGWLRVCLAYTDYPVLAIQNKLEIILEHISSGKKWQGNANRPVIRPILPSNTTSDTVHIVRLDEAEPGDYFVQIYTSIVLKPPQDFALVVTGDKLIDSITLL